MIVEMSNKQHDAYFFDMDNTLTEARTLIRPEHLELLLKLNETSAVIIVSGAVIQQIQTQIPVKNFILLSQNGNLAELNSEIIFQQPPLNEQEIFEIKNHIKLICLNPEQAEDEYYTQIRGQQISYSAIGHTADRASKEAYDPNRQVRLKQLATHPFISETLAVFIGGSTCLDYIRKDGTKGANVRRMIELKQYKYPIYLGDALFPGGNDNSVVSVCETLQINSVEETFDFIQKQLQAV
jgi:HAD superfamily hydrolase (TIGR01484 family)